MKWSIWMLALALGSSLGCGSNEDEARREAQQAADELAAELSMAAEEIGDQAAAEAAAEATEAAAGEAEAAGAAGAAGASAMQGLEQLGEALGAALQAGAQAQGGTPCEQSWNGAMAMLEALHKQLGAGNEANMPNREAFMEACNQLPEEAQQCMVPTYAMQHMEECQRVQNDPQVQRIREMMRAGAAN